MKAVYATGTNYDDPLSVLEVGTMPEPETKPFWSTIRVNSASVNHHDVWSLQGVGLFRRADADDPRHGRGWRVGRRHSRTKGT